jgi:hypothetical protein
VGGAVGRGKHKATCKCVTASFSPNRFLRRYYARTCIQEVLGSILVHDTVYRGLTFVLLGQRWPTGGPQLDLLRPPPSHRFGSIGENFQYLLNIIGAT